jgi:K+:H+ antiporter
MPLAVDPPLASSQLMHFLVQVGLLLLCAVVLGRVAVRLRMPAIIGELTAGLLLGPSLLGWAVPGLSGWLFPADPSQSHLLDALGQVGIILLVGIAGAQVDMRLLRRWRTAIARVGLAGLLIPVGLGIAAGFVLPRSLLSAGAGRPEFIMYFGVVMCVCAIPVIAKTLSDMNLLHRDVGQLTLAAAAVDDAAGWFLLSIVSAMATVGVRASQVGLSIVYLAGLLLAAVFVVRPVVRRVLALPACRSDSNATTGVAVVVILGCAAATSAMGMEPIFGAFVAGAVIGSPGVVDLRKLAPLRMIVNCVLAPIFLASAGLRVDLTAFGNWRTVLAGVVIVLVAIAGKLTGAYLGARASRLTRAESLAMGAGMNARGAVEVVVASVGLRIGVLNVAGYTIVVLVAMVTSLIAPPVLRAAMSRVEHNAAERLRRAENDAWSIPAGSPVPDALEHP